MLKPDILSKALRAVSGERRQSYGDPVELYRIVAAFWSIRLGHTVHPEEVPDCLALSKIARGMMHYKLDNFTDRAGYAQIAATVATAAQKNNTSP